MVLVIVLLQSRRVLVQQITGAAEYKRSNHQTSQSPSLSLRFQHFQVLRADKFQITLQIVRILFNLLPVFRACQKIWVLSKREFPILDKGVIYVNKFDDGTGDLSRERKDSFYWYKKVIASNGEDLA